MANDIASAVNMLKGILGDDAEDKLQAVVQELTSSDDSTAGDIIPSENTNAISSGNTLDSNTLEYLMRMKSIVDEMNNSNDDRSNLLLSLRPYMRQQRQKSIDNALKLMTLTKLSGVFGKL